MAGENIGRMQCQVAGERVAGVIEQGVEHPSHRQHGGAGIDAGGGDMALADFAADGGRTLQDGDAGTGAGEVDGGGETACPAPDDRDMWRSHHASPIRR